MPGILRPGAATTLLLPDPGNRKWLSRQVDDRTSLQALIVYLLPLAFLQNGGWRADVCTYASQMYIPRCPAPPG